MPVVNLVSRTRNLALAGAGGAALMGLMGWSASAVSPTMSGPPIQWAGGVTQIVGFSFLGVGPLYNVPSGVNFMLTDPIVSNTGTASTAAFIFTGAAGVGCSASSGERTAPLAVSVGQTVVIPFNTGLGFSSGQSVCVSSPNGPLHLTARGYLFRPS